MKLSKLGLGVVSVLVIFASAAAIIGSHHAYRYPAPLMKVAGAVPAGVRVNGSQPIIPAPVLRLSGEVIELAVGAPLTVTAIVGTNTFPATVQGNTYTVYIRSAAQEMVTVEARSPRVHYRSVVGSAGRLRTLAGSDTHLTLAEQPSLRISPYSTALGWLVRVALEDRDANSDIEFEKMTRVAASSDLEYAAYALAAFAKGELPLPDQFTGYTDGYQLLRDRDAFSQFIAYNNFREASAGYLFDQPQEMPLTGSEGLPNQLAFVNGMPRDQLPIWMGHVFLLGRRGDGRFDFNERVPVLDPVHALAVDGQGRIQLTPVGNQVRVVQKEFLVVDDYGYPNSELHWVDRTAVGRTLKRLTRGDATSVWVMRSVWNDQEQLDPSAPVVQEVDYQVLSSTELGAWSVPDAWSSVAASTTTLPWLCAESLFPEETVYDQAPSDCGYVEHRFETNGSGSTVDHGWKVDAQTMLPAPTRSLAFSWLRGAQGTLDITNGAVATSFWRLKEYPGDIGPVFYHAKALTGPLSGKTTVGINMAARKSMASWTQSAAMGNWLSGSFAFQPWWYTQPGAMYLVQRNSGGAGQETYGPDGQGSSLLPVSWQFVRNAVYDKRIRAFGSTPPYVENCDIAEINGAMDCYTRVRYFKPIARSGDRYYGIEEIYAGHIYPGYPEDAYSERSRSVLAYYDCKGGGCTSTGAIASRQGARVGSTFSPRLPPVVRPARQPELRRTFRSQQ